jgi:hypothetical protein
MIRTLVEEVEAALGKLANEDVFQEITTRKAAAPDAQGPSVYAAEFDVLSGTTDVAGHDTHDSDFYARRFTDDTRTADPITGCLDKVVLVHRLREVVAQIGFSRFDPISTDTEGELTSESVRAPLVKESDFPWRPAVENRGEGVFIQFKKDAIEAWKARPAVKERDARLLLGFRKWEAKHPQAGAKFPGAAYYLLHTLSHLLMTDVALECGYPSSSIRERVYALDNGYGILLYTGSPDAEGTLGGLVGAGKRIGHHMRNAVEAARLCSNDPVCGHHDPRHELEARFLLGAACHGCLLVAETSCEKHNDFLDRSLVVQTVGAEGAEGAEFFPAGVAG